VLRALFLRVSRGCVCSGMKGGMYVCVCVFACVCEKETRIQVCASSLVVVDLFWLWGGYE